MPMSMIKIICLTLVLVVCACDDEVKTTKHPDDSIPPISASTRKRIQTAQQFRDLFTLKQTVHLETTKESLIGGIESVHYLANEKRFIVFDSQSAKSIFVFDETGQFLHRIGKNGQGPGEYQKPSAIAYDDNQIVIYDDSSIKLLFYTLAGRYLREISLVVGHNEPFHPEKMIFLNNDLFLYTETWYFREEQGGKKYRVFRLKNGDTFDRGFGSPEDPHFGGGGIISIGNKIFYTGVFEGTIYQIDPATNAHTIFSSLGMLTDLSKARQTQNPMQYLLKHFNELDLVVSLGMLKNALFVVRREMVTILDLSGKILRRDLPQKIGDFLPTDNDDLALRLMFSFYESGIIVAVNLASRITEDDVPNPSLLFYEFIDN